MKIYSLAEYAEGADLVKTEVTHNSSDGTGTCVESDHAELPKSGPLRENAAKPESRAPRRAKGPRTKQGKDRSKNNALKFGIFSKVVVLPGESPEEFNALLAGLRDYFQPEGFEEILVERLAADLWRYRRFLLAEGAEIRTAAEFVQWDRNERSRQNAANLPQLSCNGGLIRWIESPEVSEECLDLLKALRSEIEARGFDPQFDRVTLTKLYGSHDQENWQQPLFHSYLLCSRCAAVPEERRKENEPPSSDVCKESFLAQVKAEIKRLERHQKEQAVVVHAKLELESLRRGVPDGPQLERLLRYSAAISRDVERTLNQLERLQRIRLGQQVPPPINLNVNAM